MNPHRLLGIVAVAAGLVACPEAEKPTAPPAAPAAPAKPPPPQWEVDNPVVPLPAPPLGSNADFSTVSFKVTPEKVRLGRWLFYEKRISVDGSVACSTCHRPENAFSEPTPHSTGVGGKTGARKAPTFLNEAWTIAPVFFWDGRAASLMEQAKGPMVNPVEMANEHPKIVATIAGIAGYRKAFAEAFGDDKVDLDRIVEAIASYEATRMSGNSAYDRFEAGDAAALSDPAKQGRDLFLGKAGCAQCHITGANFTDARFHNLGIGWDAKRAKKVKGKLTMDGFSDLGRYNVTHDEADVGAFKTPTLRDVSKHAPYMHDGSVATLKDTVEHYNKGGDPNPWLDPKIHKLGLSADEVAAVVAFMGALDGEGYQDSPPRSFPQ